MKTDNRNHHSGPRGPYRVVPESFRELLKKKTNWKKVCKLLNKLAFGGFPYKNYNGVETIAQPNLEAVRLLVYLTWGKPTDFLDDNVDAKKSLEDFNKIAADILLPKRDNGKKDVEKVTEHEREEFYTKPNEIN
jgi:hypothetical protein